jgi:acyl-CoA synthetase (AMP-forming)/AMP-acid ligase II
VQAERLAIKLKQGRPHVLCDMRLVDDEGKVCSNLTPYLSAMLVHVFPPEAVLVCSCSTMASHFLQVQPHDGRTVGHLQARGPAVIERYINKADSAVRANAEVHCIAAALLCCLRIAFSSLSHLSFIL